LAVNTSPKPTAAFALSALAGVITLITAFVATTAISIPLLSGTTALVWSVIAGIATFAGSWLLFNNAAKRKIGSMLVLVFSLISLNYVGLILGLIGGFLGYTFKSASVTTSNTSSR
jgi:membrane protein insertase Oxa1/YidC/SpoIIIJ